MKRKSARSVPVIASLHVRLALLALIALAAAGCSSTKVEELGRSPGLEAVLRPIGGSAATGSVRFSARRDGVAMLVYLSDVPPGRYLALVHESGLCTSSNGFSAGPPWSPGGETTPLFDRLPIVTTNSEGNGTLTVRLNGIQLNDLSGRSVIVHDRVNGPFGAEPDVRNARIACGVIGPLRSLL